MIIHEKKAEAKQMLAMKNAIKNDSKITPNVARIESFAEEFEVLNGSLTIAKVTKQIILSF